MQKTIIIIYEKQMPSRHGDRIAGLQRNLRIYNFLEWISQIDLLKYEGSITLLVYKPKASEYAILLIYIVSHGAF